MPESSEYHSHPQAPAAPLPADIDGAIEQARQAQAAIDAQKEVEQRAAQLRSLEAEKQRRQGEQQALTALQQARPVVRQMLAGLPERIAKVNQRWLAWAEEMDAIAAERQAISRQILNAGYSIRQLVIEFNYVRNPKAGLPDPLASVETAGALTVWGELAALGFDNPALNVALPPDGLSHNGKQIQYQDGLYHGPKAFL